MQRLLASALLCAFTWSLSGQSLQINEVMQSNIDCLLDDLNQYPDSWIELYNPTASTLNLNQYSLGTKRDGSDKWRMPYTTVKSHGLTVVYCDKESTGLHAPFRLESGKGCTAYLFNATNGTIVDSVYIEKKQPAPNISYGRKNEGSSEWGYQYTPTPNIVNCNQLCTEILGEPVFSEPGRVLTSGQQLSLSLSLPADAPEGTYIRYTTNGMEPTRYSAIYSNTLNFKTTTVIRAKLFKDGYLSPRSTTQSYIFLGRDMTLPVISMTTDSKFFNDSKIGIYVDGNYNGSKKNYQYDWRRPINLEYFVAPNSASELNQLCETRVSGAASRSCALKSLAVYANKRFGEKHLKYEFFPDQRPGLTKYKSIVLRNAGNDFDYLYMRDAICQRVMASHADLDWQAWRPAIFYLNGTYKGILNIRERGNSNNIYTNYDGLEDVDVIENGWNVNEGTIDNWQAFTNFFNEHGHTWEEYDERMDLNEFLNLYIMDLYFNNFDFPGNNIVMWRPREEGGRWRFIAKDVDYTMGLYGDPYNYNIFKWLYDNSYDGGHSWANRADDTRLFRRLMEDEDFKREFIDRFAIYMGDFLNYNGIWKVWQPMYNTIKTEYPTHRKLFNQWWPNYDTELSNAQSWIRNRTASLYSQMRSYYSLGYESTVKINQSLSEDQLGSISVSFNDIPLSKGQFDGKFFAGRLVTLKGGPSFDAEGQSSGLTVTGWKLERNGSTTHIEGDVCEFTMNSGTVTVTAILGEAALEQIREDTSEADTPIYDLRGRCLGRDASLLPSGIYIRNGRKIIL